MKEGKIQGEIHHPGKAYIIEALNKTPNAYDKAQFTLKYHDRLVTALKDCLMGFDISDACGKSNNKDTIIYLEATTLLKEIEEKNV